MISTNNISVRRTCQEVNMSRTSYYYAPVQNNDGIEEQLLELANKHTKYGYWKLYQKLRQQGVKVNHKKVLRLYSKNKLKLRIKSRKKLKVIRQPLATPTQVQKVWALDFTHDSLANGSKIRSLNIVDLCSSRAVNIYVDRNINSYKVIDILEQLKLEQGLPEMIRSDNGREFRCKLVQDWARDNNVHWDFIQPGKPMQNGYCERFNGTFRYEVLDAYIFDSLAEARTIIKNWLYEYNYERPHTRLHGLTPMQYEKIMMESCLL
jgi:putative transposase